MNAKDKAKELIGKMRNHCWHNISETDCYGVSKRVTIYDDKKSIDCAIIAIDEIIEAIEKIIYHDDVDNWEEVKNELEKLK